MPGLGDTSISALSKLETRWSLSRCQVSSRPVDLPRYRWGWHRATLGIIIGLDWNQNQKKTKTKDKKTEEEKP